jgi:four helix bundle protein
MFERDSAWSEVTMPETRSDFRRLEAWRQARRLVKHVYTFTDAFPDSERYCLAQQMRRAVHSVHSNIAEGSGRLSTGEWQQFLGHARGSLLELESDVIAAFDLRYCTRENAKELGTQLKRATQLVNGLLRSSMRSAFRAKKFQAAPG